MGALQKERWFYALLVTLITVSVFVGFTQTYLPPAPFAGSDAPLPVAVHIHGVSFLAWYTLLALQAALVLRGAMRLHRGLGAASLVLVVVMVATGLFVVAVRMESGLEQGDPFWAAYSLVILSNLVLFAGFFGAAIGHRRRPDQHRRYILLAAATGSGAAQFRNYMALFGPGAMAVPAGILFTNLFIVVALIGDRLIRGKFSRTYLAALPVIVLFECAMLGLASTSAGMAVQRALVEALRPFFALY
jgi:hypothetical protein